MKLLPIMLPRMKGSSWSTNGSGSRRWRAERRESRRGIQARGKIANKRFHRGMPEAIETEEIHFFHCLFSSPLLKGHAIDGGENAGAIVTEAAVHENFLPRFAAQQRQELNNLFVSGGRPATDGDVHEAHAQRFGVLALPSDFFVVLAAQIDDRGDAQQFQFR